MTRFDDHRPPLSTERFDIYYGTDLSSHDLYLEDLDLPSSRLSLLCGATAERASLDRGSGADRLSHPPRTTPDGPASPSGVTHPTRETP